MTTESFKTWRARVEMRLAHAFEAGGISYWNARDAALNIVEKTKGLRALHRQGADPAVVAASLNKMRSDPQRHAHFRSIRRHTQPKRTGGLRVRTITNVLGQSRKVRAYPDGSFHCPFCGYGAERGVCENPGCSAARYKGSSGWRYMQTPDSVRKARAASKSRRAEEKRRKQAHESAMRRGEEHRASQMTKMQEALTEAKKRGACTHCLNLSGYGAVKYVKHRGECPKKREEEWKRGQRR